MLPRQRASQVFDIAPVARWMIKYNNVQYTFSPE